MADENDFRAGYAGAGRCIDSVRGALTAIRDERLTDADKLLAKAIRAARAPGPLGAIEDILTDANAALGDHLLELAEEQLEAALRLGQERNADRATQRP